jgi:hypothetical protein
MFGEPSAKRFAGGPFGKLDLYEGLFVFVSFSMADESAKRTRSHIGERADAAVASDERTHVLSRRLV